MITLKNKKVGKMGEFHYFSIPKKLFDSGVLSDEKRYNLKIEEAEI